MFTFLKPRKSQVDLAGLSSRPVRVDMSLELFVDNEFENQGEAFLKLIDVLDYVEGSNVYKTFILGLLGLSIIFSRKEPRGDGFLYSFQFVGETEFIGSKNLLWDPTLKDWKYNKRHERTEDPILCYFSVKITPTLIPPKSLLDSLNMLRNTPKSVKYINSMLSLWGVVLVNKARGLYFSKC